jgi:hypothetical protein
VRTKDTNQKYHGGSAIISIYNPKVEGTQYSSGRVKVQNGPDSIEVGWTVSEIGIDFYNMYICMYEYILVKSNTR